MTDKSITPEEFATGYRELAALFEEEYGQNLSDLAGGGNLDDMDVWRVGRLAGVLLKKPFADRVPASNTFTGAKYSYILSRERLAARDFRESWQAVVYASLLDSDDAVENAMWLDGERKTLRFLIRKTREAICSNQETLSPWVDNSLTLGGAAFDGSQSCAALANWLAHNVPGLEGDVSKTFLAVLVFLIIRMGFQKFCSWAGSIDLSSDVESADSHEAGT